MRSQLPVQLASGKRLGGTLRQGHPSCHSERLGLGVLRARERAEAKPGPCGLLPVIHPPVHLQRPPHLPVHLKCQIMGCEKLKVASCDLHITDAQTKEGVRAWRGRASGTHRASGGTDRPVVATACGSRTLLFVVHPHVA